MNGGATYILPGVVEANESSVPVLAITTDVATTSAGRYPLTELDQEALFRPLTKWNAVLDDATRLPAAMRQAFRAMTTGRPGAVHLAFPFDVQKAEVPEANLWTDPKHTVFPAARAAPDPADIRAAVDVLEGARAAVAICGGGPVITGGAPPVDLRFDPAHRSGTRPLGRLSRLRSRPCRADRRPKDRADPVAASFRPASQP
jgi:acetolactate synthase-1/2/3 large subunit